MNEVLYTANRRQGTRHLAFYGAIAVAYERLGIDAPWDQIEQCEAAECGCMEAVQHVADVENGPNPAKID